MINNNIWKKKSIFTVCFRRAILKQLVSCSGPSFQVKKLWHLWEGKDVFKTKIKNSSCLVVGLIVQTCPCCIYSLRLQLSLILIIYQCNRTNGTILSGHFYNCIFSQLLFPRIIYCIGTKHCVQLLEELLWDHICICMPSISNACFSLQAECLLPPTLCIFPSVSILYFRTVKPVREQMEASQQILC